MSNFVSDHIAGRRAQVAGAIVVALAVVLLVPAVASPVWLGIAVQGLLLSLPVLGLTVLAGYGGQFSIASAGFLAVGAGVFVQLTDKMGLSLPLGLLGAVLAGAITGLVVGLPALRLRGVYLLLSTLAAHFILIYFFGEYASKAFGVYGVTFGRLEVFGFAFDTDKKWFYLLSVLVVLVSMFVSQLRRTGVGRSLLAIKQNEVAAAASGIDVARVKLSAFVASSALIAFTGALFGLYFMALSSDFFTLQMAINMYVALVVGGQLAAMGAVIGSMFVVAGPTLVASSATAVGNDWVLVHAPELTHLFFGVAIIVVLLVQPKGVWGLGTSVTRALVGRVRSGKAVASSPIVVDEHESRPAVTTSAREAPVSVASPGRTVTTPGHLAVAGLTISYGGTSHALDDVTLQVPTGARVALLGANGAGKTTLVRAVTGMTKFHGARVLGGDVHFGESVITSESAARTTKRGITQVPEGRQMFGHLTVEENLQLGGLTVPTRGLSPRVEDALAFFPALSDKRKMHAGLLSGGEQQMLALARALVSGPKLLVIDELTLGLSPVMVETVVELLLDVLERTDAGLLLVEQNAQLALDVCEYGYVLDRGVITTSGPAADLSEDTRVQDAYLGRRRDEGAQTPDLGGGRSS